jgi:hypothetical protein
MIRVKLHNSAKSLRNPARGATDADGRDRICMVLHALEGGEVDRAAARVVSGS